MIGIEEQKELFIDISNQLDRKITAFALGGTAMMFLGVKAGTKDIDLVFPNKKDREDFMKAAKKAGWREMDSKLVYQREERPKMLKLGETRLDLFLNNVIDFIFSKPMQSRSSKKRQFGNNLMLKIVNPHDLILMKCATDRKKDLKDAKDIIGNKDINFETIAKEAEHQLSLGKERAVLELGNFLEKLEKNVDIPKKILDKLWDKLRRQIEGKSKE